MKYIIIIVVAGILAVACKSKKPVSITALNDEVEISTPCFGVEFYSTSSLIRASAIGESMDQQMARRMSRQAALEDLGTKIGVAIESVISGYYNSRNMNLSEDLRQRFEGRTDLIVQERISGYRVICERFTRTPERNFKCYMAIEIGVDDIARAVHQGLNDEQILRIDYDYEQFKERFNEAMQRAN